MNSPNEFMASRANELRLIHLNYDAVTVSRDPCGLTSDILSATSAKRRSTAKLKLWICDFSLNRSTRLDKPFSRFDFWQTLGRNAIATVNVTGQLFERLPPRAWWTWKSVTQYHRQNERDTHEKWNGTSASDGPKTHLNQTWTHPNEMCWKAQKAVCEIKNSNYFHYHMEHVSANGCDMRLAHALISSNDLQCESVIQAGISLRNVSSGIGRISHEVSNLFTGVIA